MNQPTHSPNAPLNSTPTLERLLARLAGHLGRLAWMQGLGAVLAVLALWLSFAFVADYALHVPRGVRWLHLGVCIAAPLFALWRLGLAPWLRRPDRAGLAVLVERERPQLRQLFVSAVQLQQAPPADAHPELIQRVLRSAEIEAARTDLAGVLDPRAPRRWLVGGLSAAALVFLAARTWPDHAAIFGARLFGAEQPWPQLTQLEMTLGVGLEDVPLEPTANGVRVRLPRGSDAPIVVRALGEQPDDVRLHLGDESSVALNAGADGLYRTVLRGLREDVLLSASGGDDRDREPTLEIVVLEPPDIAGLALRITPPSYTGLAERVEFDRDVEVLAGSKVEVAIRPHPANARGKAHLLPADERVELTAVRFPSAPPSPGAGAEPASDGAAEDAPNALGFGLVAVQSLRYRIELIDDSGLSNPDPGLFAIQVVRDERPQLEWLAPARNELETLPRGAVRLLARADDDFGLQGAQWRAKRSGEADAAWADLELAAPLDEASAAARPNARVVGVRVDVASLAVAERVLGPGDQLEFELRAFDTRPRGADGELDPAGVAAATPLRVRIVGEEDFLRRLGDRLARVRAQTAEAESVARERVRRTGELLRTVEGDQGLPSANDTTGLVSGQRRLQSDLDALTRELASCVENVLYARLDESAGPALADLDARLARTSARTFPAQAWRDFAAAARAGTVFTPGVPGQLTALLERSLALSVVSSPEAIEALERATRAAEPDSAHGALSQALAAQTAVHAGLVELLEQLAEWDNFQAVLTLTRDILTRQKTVRDRTRDASGADPRSERR